MSSLHKREDVVDLVRQLVGRITKFEVGSDVFLYLEKHILTKIQHADTMVFITKKDIDTSITKLSEKYSFHGFDSQGMELKKFYEKFLPAITPKAHLETKLNIVKFLLCMSDSPTNYFLENPSGPIVEEHEEQIDWGAYLREGIERWSPPTADSEIWTEESESDHDSEDVDVPDRPILQEKATEVRDAFVETSFIEYSNLRQKLYLSVQNTWFNKDELYLLPKSSNVDANIAIHWDDYMEYATMGLLSLKKSSIITEYKVMREAIWQFWIPHESFTFHFIGDVLLPKPNVTISSVRPISFETFMHEFLPYINILQQFREFHKNLNSVDTIVAPGTYKCYDYSLTEIIKPMFEELIKLEVDVLKQETIMTLLKISSRLRTLLKDVTILKGIHDSVIMDFKTRDASVCATHLLTRLHDGLLHCVTKTEQDIYLTLYLDSLFKYFSIINSWLSTDSLRDNCGEFIIVNGNFEEPQGQAQGNVTEDNICLYDGLSSDSDSDVTDGRMHFVLRDLDEFAENDSILRIISTDVLQIGKNIHLLGLLKKWHLLDFCSEETLHEALISRVLTKISEYFKHTDDGGDQNTEDAQTTYKFPAICPDYCKYPTEMDRLENLVDTSDGFLMKAFESFFIEQPPQDKQREKTLYEKISQMTKCIFPVKQIIDDVFVEILRERYSSSGFKVKNLLIEEYKIQRHFELVKHIFLFKDDLIFPWYRRLFQQMERGSHFDNDIWLTTHLQDVIMDLYPELYERCNVKACDMWSFYKDPLKACGLVSIEYLIDWPITMLIRTDQLHMYKQLFQFILKIKWALYTLNHMYFNEFESQVKSSKQSDAVTIFLRRLKVYRFCLLNEFSKIQHYILGYICSKAVTKFDLDFEKTHNLDTLISSHSNFINYMYSTSMYFRDFNQNSYGFNYLLYLVTKLRLMWNDLKSVDDRELYKFEKSFKLCHENLEPIMNQEDISLSE